MRNYYTALSIWNSILMGIKKVNEFSIEIIAAPLYCRQSLAWYWYSVLNQPSESMTAEHHLHHVGKLVLQVVKVQFKQSHLLLLPFLCSGSRAYRLATQVKTILQNWSSQTQSHRLVKLFSPYTIQHILQIQIE